MKVSLVVVVLMQTGDQSTRSVLAWTVQVRFSPPATRNWNGALLVGGSAVTRIVRSALRRLRRPPVRQSPASAGQDAPQADGATTGVDGPQLSVD